VFDNLLPVAPLPAQLRPTPRVLIKLQAGREEHRGRNPPLFTDAGYPLLPSIVPGSQSGHKSAPDTLPNNLPLKYVLSTCASWRMADIVFNNRNLGWKQNKSRGATAQAFSRRSLTVESRVYRRVIPRGICGVESGTGTGVSQNYSGFPCL
jgi:hypothetical protein